MTFFRDLVTYLKDNPEGYWFKAKLYGWGWTPARWQGWVVLGMFVAAVLLNFWRIDARSLSADDTLVYLVPQTALMVVALVVICYVTGERPRWMWGPPHQEVHEEHVKMAGSDDATS